jgi:hypothetical protein
MNDTSHTKATIFGGTLTIFFANIGGADLLKTVILGAVGAVVSFIISQLLKFAIKQCFKRKSGNK